MAFLGISIGTPTASETFANQVKEFAKDGFDASEALKLHAAFQTALDGFSGVEDHPTIKQMKAAMEKYPGLSAYVQKGQFDALPDDAKARIQAVGSAAIERSYANDDSKGVPRLQREENGKKAYDVATASALAAETAAHTKAQLATINIGNSGWKGK